MQFGLEVHHNLDLLSTLVQTVTYCGILGSRVLCERHIRCARLLHILSTSNEFFNVETSASDRQQTYWSEYRETTTYVIGDDEALVTLLVSTSTGSTLLGIGNGYDNFLSLFLTTLSLALFLQQTEGKGSLSGGATLRDVNHTELLVLKVLSQLEEIIFTDVVTSEKNGRILLVLNQPSK